MKASNVLLFSLVFSFCVTESKCKMLIKESWAYAAWKIFIHIYKKQLIENVCRFIITYSTSIRPIVVSFHFPPAWNVKSALSISSNLQSQNDDSSQAAFTFSINTQQHIISQNVIVLKKSWIFIIQVGNFFFINFFFRLFRYLAWRKTSNKN
jgi:hypothetical protein